MHLFKILVSDKFQSVLLQCYQEHFVYLTWKNKKKNTYFADISIQNLTIVCLLCFPGKQKFSHSVSCLYCPSNSKFFFVLSFLKKKKIHHMVKKIPNEVVLCIEHARLANIELSVTVIA